MQHSYFVRSLDGKCHRFVMSPRVTMMALGAALLLTSAAFAGEGPLTIVSRSANERQWRQTNQKGEVLTQFTEIGTGLCYWDAPAQTWRDSDPTIEIRAGIDGAIADRGAHSLKLASDAKDAVATVVITMPDGSQIRLQTVGLALTTLDNSDSVFIGELQSSVGEKVDGNTVIYRNAFAPVKADLRVRNSLAGVESDVILRERIDPTQWGLQPNNCRLEVWTQVIQSPAAMKTVEQIPGRRRGNADQDENIDFPSMSFTKGTAFQLNSKGQHGGGAGTGVRVAKEFIHLDDVDMTFLIESLPFEEAEESIKELPVNEARVKPDLNSVRRMMAKNEKGRRSKPVSLASKTEKADRHVALLDRPTSIEDQGYVIDFNISGNQSAYTFRGDTTYYATADVILSGITTFEGGTVIKLANGPASSLIVNGGVSFLSSHYRPAVITVVSDNTVGDKIGAYTQIATNAFVSGAVGLKLQNGLANSVNNVLIRHVETALWLNSGASADIRHAQIINCRTALNASGGATLRNVLIATPNSTPAVIAGTGAIAIRGEHVTIDAPSSAVIFSSAGSATLAFYNSIIYGGVRPGVYTMNSSVDNWLTNPFQTVGAGSHYLNPAIAGARDAGVTSGINPSLITELRQMTTDGPTLLNSPIAAPLTLYPCARRDIDTLDLGYHYDALDYYFTSLDVSSALTVSSGVNLAMYGDIGLRFISAAASFVSKGAPDSLNHYVHYQMVQEQPTANGWPSLGTLRAFFWANSSGGSAQKIALTFCDLSPGGGNYLLCEFSHSGLNCPDVSVTHSSLRNIGMNLSYSQVSPNGILGLTNNCWERCTISLQSSSTLNFYLRMFNNLFWKGAGTIGAGNAPTPFTVKDNFFDFEAFVESEATGAMTAANNAFAAGLTAFGFAPKTGIVADYQAGPQGRFYYPITGPNLATLINAGSVPAGTAGLSQFTTTGSKEIGQVDIGFHYAVKEEIWIEDGIPPAPGVITDPTTEAANWVWSATPTPVDKIGTSFKSPGLSSGYHLQYFYSALPVMNVRAGDTVFGYVFINPLNIPSEIMFQWHAVGAPDWNRAYWGINNAFPNWLGTDGTPSKRGMGALPINNKWVRLEVPASLVDLEGKTVDGFGFTLWGGQVNFDKIGRTPAGAWMDTDGDGIADYIEDTDGDTVTDATETAVGLADTDGDGLTDGIEALLGYNPLKPKGTDTAGTIGITLFTPLKD